MKIPISHRIYNQLIKDIFKSIHDELIKTAVIQEGVLFYELNTNEVEMYPNYKVVNNKTYPVIKRDSYIKEYKDLLDKEITPKLQDKYVQYDNYIFEYYDRLKARFNPRNTIQDNMKTGNLSELFFDRFLLSFDLSHCYKFKDEDINELLNPEFKDLQKLPCLKIISKDSSLFYDTECGYDKTHLENFNVLCIDELFFLDAHFPKIDEDESLFNLHKELTKISGDKTNNPMINIFHSFLVKMFVFTSFYYDKFHIESSLVNFFTETSSKSNTNYISRMENNSTLLISSIINEFNFREKTYYSPFSFSHISPEVSYLYMKAIVLLINQNALYEDNYEDGFYNFIGKDRKSKNIEKKEVMLNKILNKTNSSLLKNQLTVKNIATLLYFLQKEDVIVERLSNSEVALLIHALTGQSENTLARALNEIHNTTKKSSSDRILKSSRLKQYTEELKKLLIKIIDKL